MIIYKQSYFSEIGFCQCFSGFAGGDCSVSTNQPPALTATFTENKCDVNKTICMEVPVFGTNFHKSQYLQCRFQEKEVSFTLYILIL